jgi:hypothetical protein
MESKFLAAFAMPETNKMTVISINYGDTFDHFISNAADLSNAANASKPCFPRK